MTLVTLFYHPKLCRATKGARRATVVALHNFARRHSGHAVVVHCYGRSCDRNVEFLLLHVDGRDRVFVYCLFRQAELFTKDIQYPFTSDEPNHVITPTFGLRQGVPGSLRRIGKPHCLAAQIQGRLRCLSFELAKAIHRIVLLLKEQGFPTQIRFRLHHYPSQEPYLVAIVELLNHAVPPRLGHGNEPRLDSVEQAEPYQVTHAPRVLATSIEDSFVVNLHVIRHSQTAPNRPDSVYRVLTCFIQNWADRTSSGCQIDVVQTEETNWPAQIARTNEVHLVRLVNSIAGQLGVLLAFGYVASRPAMDQPLTIQDPIDRAQRWYGFHPSVFKLPLYRLCSAKQTPIVQVQANQLDRLDCLGICPSAIAVWGRRQAVRPITAVIPFLVAFDPLIDPFPRAPYRLRYSRRALSVQVSLDRNHPVVFRFPFHRHLLSQEAIDVQATPHGVV